MKQKTFIVSLIHANHCVTVRLLDRNGQHEFLIYPDNCDDLFHEQGALILQELAEHKYHSTAEIVKQKSYLRYEKRMNGK